MKVAVRRDSRWAVYRVPLVIAVLSALGLTSALLGDGVWDWWSWVLLGTPVIVGLYCWLRRVPAI